MPKISLFYQRNVHCFYDAGFFFDFKKEEFVNIFFWKTSLELLQ